MKKTLTKAEKRKAESLIQVAGDAIRQFGIMVALLEASGIELLGVEMEHGKLPRLRRSYVRHVRLRLKGPVLFHRATQSKRTVVVADAAITPSWAEPLPPCVVNRTPAPKAEARAAKKRTRRKVR